MVNGKIDVFGTLFFDNPAILAVCLWFPATLNSNSIYLEVPRFCALLVQPRSAGILYYLVKEKLPDSFCLDLVFFVLLPFLGLGRN